MEKKSVFIRAIKFAAVSSTIILLLVLYKMFTTEVAGTTSEAVIRFLITVVGVFSSMYLVFVLYLYFNPDADQPRKKQE